MGFWSLKGGRFEFCIHTPAWMEVFDQPSIKGGSVSRLGSVLEELIGWHEILGRPLQGMGCERPPRRLC